MKNIVILGLALAIPGGMIALAIYKYAMRSRRDDSLYYVRYIK